MKRKPRTRRQAGVLVELTARDEALLRALARFRIASTSDLVLLFFDGIRRDTAAQRLRRLFDAGYLEVRMNERSEENLYSLGPEGRQWLRGRDLVVEAIPRGGLTHHLAIVRVWAGLASAVHQLESCRLEVFKPDWEIRRELRGQVGLVVPDALLQLSVQTDDHLGGFVRLAVEVDRRTERPPEVERKVRAYELQRMSAHGFWGWQDVGLLLVLEGSGSARRRSLAEIVRREWGSWLVIWDEGESPGPVLRRVLESGTAPLQGSPYGNGEGRRRK